MALKISFEGYVNEVKPFTWGTVLKMSHSQRAKNQQTGEWETVGKDYLDVTVEDASNIHEGDVLAVTGTFKVETFQKRDGSTGVGIKVRASEVSPVERGARGAASATNTDWATPLQAIGATPIDEEAPF